MKMVEHTVTIMFEAPADTPGDHILTAIGNAIVQIEEAVGAMDESGNDIEFDTFNVRSYHSSRPLPDEPDAAGDAS